MRLFLKKITIFFFFLFCYFGIVWLSNQYLISQSELPFKKAQVLIVGDSHVQRAINPKYFADAQNIAQTAETYVASYWKLKYILNKVKIDTVILGFAHHNISAFNDKKFVNEEAASGHFARLYAIQEFHKLDKIPVNWLEFYKIYFRNMLLIPKTNHHLQFIGGFNKSKKSNVKDYQGAINKHFYTGKKEIASSNTAIEHLHKIIDLCQQYKATLILLDAPVHTHYYNLIPAKFLSLYETEKIKAIQKGAFAIEKATSKYDDELYLNANHLNTKGANRFTPELIKALQK